MSAVWLAYQATAYWEKWASCAVSDLVLSDLVAGIGHQLSRVRKIADLLGLELAVVELSIRVPHKFAQHRLGLLTRPGTPGGG